MQDIRFHVHFTRKNRTSYNRILRERERKSWISSSKSMPPHSFFSNAIITRAAFLSCVIDLRCGRRTRARAGKRTSSRKFLTGHVGAAFRPGGYERDVRRPWWRRFGVLAAQCGERRCGWRPFITPLVSSWAVQLCVCLCPGGRGGGLRVEWWRVAWFPSLSGPEVRSTSHDMRTKTASREAKSAARPRVADV